MPEADGTPLKRTIDERLDALTMNFELREAQWQHESEQVRELRESFKELRESQAELGQTIGTLSEAVDDMRTSLGSAIENLVAVAISHTQRITQSERLAS